MEEYARYSRANQVPVLSVVIESFLISRETNIVAYQFGAVYIKFVGAHAEYSKIDAATIELE